MVDLSEESVVSEKNSRKSLEFAREYANKTKYLLESLFLATKLKWIFLAGIKFEEKNTGLKVENIVWETI